MFFIISKSKKQTNKQTKQNKEKKRKSKNEYLDNNGGALKCFFNYKRLILAYFIRTIQKKNEIKTKNELIV